MSGFGGKRVNLGFLSLEVPDLKPQSDAMWFGPPHSLHVIASNASASVLYFFLAIHLAMSALVLGFLLVILEPGLFDFIAALAFLILLTALISGMEC